MSDILNPNNWLLVHQNTYTAQPVPNEPDRFFPLTTLNIVATSNALLIGGQSNKAKPTWYLAASVVPKFRLALPNSAFSPNIQIEPVEYRIPLNRLVLLRFKNYGADIYFLEIRVPFWHQEINIEVWQYTKLPIPIDVDEKLENLNQLAVENRANIAILQASVDRIEQNINTTTGQ